MIYCPESEAYCPGYYEHKWYGNKGICEVAVEKVVPVVVFEGVGALQVSGYVYGVGYAVNYHGNGAKPGDTELVNAHRFKKAEGNYAQKRNNQVEKEVVVHKKNKPVFSKLRN